MGLAAEYAGPFLNVGKRPACPYESVYTSPERLLMQEARDEVLAVYREEGLSRSEALKEPEDHIAIEFEFMAHLCQKAVAAFEQGDRAACLASLEKQRSFLEQHLLVWVPDFCRDVEGAATTDFYRGVAQLTAEFLVEEREALGELTAALQG